MCRDVICRDFASNAKIGDQSSASQLVVLLRNLTFHLDVFESIFKKLRVCKRVCCKSMKESIRDDEFHRVLERNGGGRNEGNGNLYEKNLCKVLRRKADLNAKEYIMIYPEQRNVYRR